MRFFALLLLALVLFACGGTPGSFSAGTSASPSGPAASASPSATTSELVSPSATAASSTEPAAVAVDSLVEIIGDLVVRSDPGIEPPSTMFPAGLSPSDRAFVVDGPVAASGYAWYLVAPLTRGDGSSGPFGWIAAASREGEAWVRSIEPPCPATVDLAALLDLQPLERLACFGEETLTVDPPAISCGAGSGPWTWDPAWLVMVGGCGLSLDAGGEGVLLYRVPPGGTDPSPGPVVGHFDDAAAASCNATTADPAILAPSREEAVVICRTQFVIGAP